MRLLALAMGVAFTLTGCGGGDAEPVDPTALEGVWTYELPYDYLVENGIGTYQAEEESGTHTITLADGEFKDSWETAEGRRGSCRGTYRVEAATVVFRWTYACWGDWEMRPEFRGRQVTWSHIEALPPYDTEEDQRVNKAFNSVPWTRVGDAPTS
jgi:hypothetical protein